MTDSDRLVTRLEAARRLAVSPDLIRKMQSQGDLPTVHVGRTARVRQSDLDRFIAAAASAPGGPDE